MATAGSVDGLVEASRQSRVCGGAANEIMCAIFRVLMEVSHILIHGVCGCGRLLDACNSYDGCFRDSCVCHCTPWQMPIALCCAWPFDKC